MTDAWQHARKPWVSEYFSIPPKFSFNCQSKIIKGKRLNGGTAMVKVHTGMALFLMDVYHVLSGGDDVIKCCIFAINFLNPKN